MPTQEVIQAVKEAYERGKVLDALRRAEQSAPLKDWRGVEGCVLAARIAVNCGAPRLESRLSVRVWRAAPNSAAAQLQYGYEFSEQRGAAAFLMAVRGWPETPDATPDDVAEMLALRARAHTDLRDFSNAEALLDRAEKLSGKPWVHLQRAHLLERQDRVEDALSAAKSAMALHPHPFHRPAVQTIAYLLQVLDRDPEAIDVLEEAGSVLQSGPVAAQLYSLLQENGRWAEASRALERYVELSPLLETGFHKWVASQRARVAYHLGKRKEAAVFAVEAGSDFDRRFAEKLNAEGEQGERVQLDVTFVRQHFKTCAPATLAALGRYWKMPGDHLKLAEAMCYDGTPSWQQREWAEQNGWHVREFSVTHESAVALIRRGIPFAMAIVETTTAHMMALIGFDSVRSTILLRDPGRPYVLEAAAEEFLKRYSAFGPHGMVFVPEKERARLDGLSLPDSELWDEYNGLLSALARHDREHAKQRLARMEQASPDHALVWQARLEVAAYDSNLSERIRCLDRLLELFPENAVRLLQRIACMGNASRAERIGFLEKACANRDSDPMLLLEMARALQGDARCVSRARICLKRARHSLRNDSNVIGAVANLLWDRGQREEATELYRQAATLESFREPPYRSWFIACRQTRQVEKAMVHLQERFERFGSRSEQPALTLAWALCEMEQPVRAREVLLQAMQLRPSDGYLVLRAATILANLGEHKESQKLLASAKDRVRENDWLRTAAEIAENRLDFVRALEHARRLLEFEPLAMDAHSCVVRARARIEGTHSAIAHLKEATQRFPHYYSLQRMLVEWSSELGPSETEAAARELLRIDPADAWAHRELALALSKLGRTEDASNHAREAISIEPQNSYSYSVYAHIRHVCNDTDDAKRNLRRAVELSVDNGGAIAALLGLAGTDTERKQALTFVQEQLFWQVVQGDGLLAWVDMASPILEPHELLAELRLAHRERPDLWHAWSSLSSQLARMGQLDEALSIARQASEKVSHLPCVWLDLSSVHRWRNEPDAEITAAQRAFEINPGWARAALALSDAFARAGKFDAALDVFERALKHLPRIAHLHGARASLLWRQGKAEEALEAIEQALRLAPEYESAWSQLHEWSVEAGQNTRAATLARELTQERAGETSVWLNLARMLHGTETLAERLNAVDQALRLNSKLAEAWDLKAELLVEAELFDRAIATCNDGLAACSTDLFMLRGRIAWIQARRRRMDEAIDLMRAVLTENASYAWGWHHLAVWLSERGEIKDALEAMEKLRRFRPHDPWLLRRIGHLHLQLKNQADAKQAFGLALSIQPTDEYAAEQLFDLQIETGDHDGAAATLELMKTHQPGSRTLACEVVLHVQNGMGELARGGIETLCFSPDPDAWPLEKAVSAYRKRYSSGNAIRILRPLLTDPRCHPETGAVVIRMLVESGSHFSALRTLLQLKSEEAQIRAVDPLILALAEKKRGWLFSFLMWRRRDVIRKNPLTWGRAGYALTKLKRYRAVASWQSDWRERPDVQPWTLFNQCLALRQLGRVAEANEIASQVVNNLEHRDGARDMRLFLAVEEALSGNLDAAREHLEKGDARNNVAYDSQLLALTKAIVEFDPESGCVSAWEKAVQTLKPHFSEFALKKAGADVRRTFRRTGKILAARGAGWRARLWFAWHLNWQWMILPGALVLIALLIPIVMHVPIVLIAVVIGVLRGLKK